MPFRETPPVPRVCDICKQPKKALKRLTEQLREPIYVCVTGKPKSKMPCDGWIFDVAASHDND